MGGKFSRDKGKRGEREIVDLLQPVVNEVYELHGLEPPKLKRNTLQSDGGGSDIAGLLWAAIEVKYHSEISLGAWWAQTIAQAGPDQEPILFYRRNNIPWKVKMYGILGKPGCAYTVPVIVDTEHFLAWFRARLSQELER